MKKILLLVLGVALLSLSSCFKVDNWDEPDCNWQGTVTDSYTNKAILSSQNDWQMRIWERSWTGHEGGATNYQDLRIKQDGTYQNSKLFAGTYDFLPYNGPFWPMDTVKSVVLKKNLTYDFTVTPYLQIVDFNAVLYGKDSIRVTFKVKAPLRQKDGRTLPRLYELRAFMSLTPYCGNGSDSSIGEDYSTNTNINSISEAKGLRVTLNNNTANGWDSLLAGSSDNTTPQITLFHKMRSGYTYNVRVGASVDDTYRKHCYSPIIQIVCP